MRKVIVRYRLTLEDWADGASYKEAVKNAQVVIQEWLDTARSLGRPVPRPRGRLSYA